MRCLFPLPIPVYQTPPKGKCWCLWKPLKLDIHLRHNSLTSHLAQHVIFISLNHRFYFIYNMYEEKSGYDRISSQIVFSIWHLKLRWRTITVCKELFHKLGFYFCLFIYFLIINLKYFKSYLNVFWKNK